ncbi:MAG: hypothetical protein FRX49_03299 [Trebouxia sp. A1-2]|nr:MAG: hypothetical protein FRX49_03299 [Trebouxia sp. A1-2]
MGKKKASKKKGSQAGDEDSESAASASTLSSLADLGFDDSSAIEDDPFEASIDALFEKRQKGDSQHFDVELHQEGRCGRGSLSMQGNRTVFPAALLLITLGAGNNTESLQQDAHPVFQQAACYGKAVAVKAAAIEALAITAFVASSDPDVVDKCMTGFANLWKAGPAKVSTAAIRGWSLLLSTVPTWRMTTSRIEASLQSLANQLHSGDVEVRAAAGEAIALLYHTCGISDLDSFLEDQDEPDLSPPASPVSHGQIPREQKPAPHNYLALLNSGNQPHSVDITQTDSQPNASTQAISCSAESHLEPQHGELSRGESRPTAPEPSSQDLPEQPGSSQNECDQSSASGPAADADQVCQSMNGNPGVKVTENLENSYQQSPHTMHSPSNDDAGPSNGSPSQRQPMTPPTRIQTPSTGDVSSGQPSAKSKEAHQGRSKSAVRNPKQQAEAVSNGLDDVVSHMKELATNRGDKHRRSRRDRASTRSTFRDLCNIVEQDGTVAQTKVKLRHGDTLVINTLVGTVQLNALRRFLAEGFQTHLQQNPLLHQIFDFEPREERAERLTPLEKKMYRSPASAESKSRTQQRNHDRAATKAYKGAMISEEWS